MRNASLALFLAAACGDDGAAAKRDASLPRDTMDQPLADAPPLLACTPRNGTTITFRQLPSVDDAAMLATSPPGDGRLFVVERHGKIRVFENEQLRPTPFLEINTTNVPGFREGGEQGLLGLAFHPNYAVNRQFFVYYTTSDANVVARYYVSETDYNRADPAGEIVLSIPDFASNHNGGMIEFGADGYLYIATGDGGGGGDPCHNALEVDRTASTCVAASPPRCQGNLGSSQNCEPLHGKMLRIDVNTTTGIKNYGIPSDNPYAAGGGEPEIFMIGLRNPWRWSFDRATGDMYIGDVGQEIWEEVTVLSPAQQNGANLGWSRYEGNADFDTSITTSGAIMPHFTRNQGNDNWLSVIGGQVYRGTCFPDIVGDYYFTDYAARDFMRGVWNGATLTATEVGTSPANPASIHADARGELYLTTTGGGVYQIEAGP